MESHTKKGIVITGIVISVVSVTAAVFSSGRWERSFTNLPVEPATSSIAKPDPVPEETIATEVVPEEASDSPTTTADAVPVEPVEKASSKTVEEPPVPAPADTEKRSDLVIVDRLVPFGHEDRSSRAIDTVVVHSSYDALGSDPYSVSGIIEEYQQYGVAAHYLIDRKGKIYRLVEDRDVAYHAGVSEMPDGRTGANAFSIGIELVEKDTDSPTSAQYASLRALVTSLKEAYPIKYVLGHSDIAPGRKTDPWGFDWKELTR